MNSVVINNTTRTSTAIADSGCTGHFLQVDSPCLNKTPTSNGLRVLLPDGSTIQATHTALPDIPNLPIAARQAHIFPQLEHNALILISQFCDHGCTALFTSTDVQILVNSTTIIRGSRQPTTGLWTNRNHQPPTNESLATPPTASTEWKPKPSSSLTYTNAAIAQPLLVGSKPSKMDFYHLAWPGREHCPKTSPQVIRHHQRPSTTAIQKHLVHVTCARKGEF
jgi:hypothetical protein